MNQKIVEYLRVNKDTYPKEVLLGALRQAGHPDVDIEAAQKQVYAQSNVVVMLRYPWLNNRPFGFVWGCFSACVLGAIIGTSTSSFHPSLLERSLFFLGLSYIVLTVVCLIRFASRYRELAGGFVWVLIVFPVAISFFFIGCFYTIAI